MGYYVKMVLLDKGSGAKIMYPNLYKGLNLKLEDSTGYDSPLLGFNGKMVIPKVSSNYLCRQAQR